MEILVAGITESDVTTSFVSSIMQMQQTLAHTPDVSVAFEFFADVNKALSYFEAQKKFEALVVVDGNVAVNPEFLLSTSEKEFIVAAHALRTIDWGLVEAGAGGAMYNFDASTGTSSCDTSGMYIKNPTITQCRIFRITRLVLDTIISRHGDVVRADDGNIIAHAPAVLEGKALSADQALLALWGGDVYVDITAKTQNMGPLDYVGCIGQRKVLR